MPDDRLEMERLQCALQDRYELKRVLGHGGMATVYLAEEPRHSRHLALKVLRRELAATIGADRFLREIRTIASLTHPHILPLFDSGEADGLLFYVMPYVEGETLRQRLKRERQLPINDAIQIAEEVGDALSFAHGRGIVHRDIKPENILLEAGHAVIADFGIAKAITLAAGEELTNMGFAVGTPHYMSPEQAAADPSVDGRSDLYSLGCVLFEMLSGNPPFAASAPQALFAQKLLETAPLLKATRSGIPEHVERAVARALRRVPSERYPTILQFVDALTSATLETLGDGDRLNTTIPVNEIPRLPIEIRPLDEEVDVFGVTHPGKIERVNQDHFLICSIRREMHFHHTSLPDNSQIPRKGERRAMVAIIADGLGRDQQGEEASRHAIEVVAQQLMHSIKSFAITTPADDLEFISSLYSIAIQCQANVEQRTWENSAARGSGFGLAMWIGMWPMAYIVEIGPGRIYQFADGKLFRLSALHEMDEASRQQMMEATGNSVVTPHQVAPHDTNRVRHLPVIYRTKQRWDSTGLICTRGLTEHVSEIRIAERLAACNSSRHACETLLADALANGGTENITVVVGRAVQQRP